jgi:GT2 family glycosyltransferase
MTVKNPQLSVIMPVQDGAHFLPISLGALQRSTFRDFEIIVADDGSRDESARVAAELGTKVVSSGSRLSAAYARNAGVQCARAPIVVFVDADVAVSENALAQIADRLATDPSLCAVFGAYDDTPTWQSIVSRFRNLLHSYFHRRGNSDATTFWTGLGAVRRAAFDAVGGFDPDQTLEDVELGVRLHFAGNRIALEPSIQGTHLKRWTLLSMIKTDLFGRGVPWIQLALRNGSLRDDLNTSWTQRISVAATGLLLAAAAAASVIQGLAFLAPALALIVALMLPAWWDPDMKRSAVRVLAGPGLASAVVVLLLMVRASYAAGALGLLIAMAALCTTIRPRATLRLLAALFALLIVIACVFVLAAFPISVLTIVAAFAWVLEIALNRNLFGFLARRMGIPDVLACAPLLLIYHTCCGVAVLAGIALHVAQVRPRGADSAAPGPTAP